VTPIAAGESERTLIPGLLPAGLDAQGFVGTLPQTATPAPLLLAIGTVLGALAWLTRRRRPLADTPFRRWSVAPTSRAGCADHGRVRAGRTFRP
jgi:LPXTG-motif cell wall-anchored protein